MVDEVATTVDEVAEPQPAVTGMAPERMTQAFASILAVLLGGLGIEPNTDQAIGIPLSEMARYDGVRVVMELTPDSVVLGLEGVIAPAPPPPAIVVPEAPKLVIARR
jgi:hypothetical protein